jgi:mediator of RNA polymerase II transcription subunit 14
MRSLGWADYLKVEMNNNRKSLVVSYWVYVPPSSPQIHQLTPSLPPFPSRPQPPIIPGRPAPPPNANRIKLPPTGGTLSISIVEANASPLVPGGGPARSSKARVLAELQARSKFGIFGGAGAGVGVGRKASDEVEGLKFEVRWETSKGAFGLKVAEEDVRVGEGELRVVSYLFV